MDIRIEDKKLYLVPTPEERRKYIPLLPTVKLDRATGMLVMPSQGILPLLTIVPQDKLIPKTSETAKILDQGALLIKLMSKYKTSITNNEMDIKIGDFPFLMKHQAVCNVISKYRHRYAFFLDTGTR